MPFGEKSTHTCISWEAFKKRNREGSFQPPREIFPTVGWSHFTPYSVFFSICLQKPTCACAISWWRQIHGFFFPCNPSFLVQPLPRSPSPAVPIYLPPRDKQQSWDEILFFHRTPHWLPLRKLALKKNICLTGCKIHNLCSFALNPPSKSCSCCIFNHQGVSRWESSCGRRWDQNPRVSAWKKG